MSDKVKPTGTNNTSTNNWEAFTRTTYKTSPQNPSSFAAPMFAAPITQNDGLDPVIKNFIAELVKKSSSEGFFAADGVSSESFTNLLIQINNTLSQHGEQPSGITQERKTTYIQLSEKPKNTAISNANSNTGREVLISIMAEPKAEKLENAKPANSPLATYSVPVHKDVDLKEIVKNAKIDVRLYIEEESQSTNTNTSNVGFVSSGESAKSHRHEQEQSDVINATASKNSANLLERKAEYQQKGQLQLSHTQNEIFTTIHKQSVEKHHYDDSTHTEV